MTIVRTVAAAAFTGLCAGASAMAASPDPAQLAPLVFPGWTETHAGRLQTVALPAGPVMPDSGWHAGSGRVIVDPRLVVRTDADHVTLIATLAPAGEDGKPAVQHMTPLAVAAYQFTRAGADWRLTGRQGVFAWRGFFGQARLQQVTLATGPKSSRQAVGIEYGSCWDGYCGTWLALYELDASVVRREPAVETALAGNNIDGAADCLRRLQPVLKVRPQDANVHDDGSPAGTHDCYSIESSWNIDPARDQPGDLVVRYQGAISRADSYAGPPVTIDQRQVLHYERGKYRAVSGFNPVPPI